MSRYLLPVSDSVARMCGHVWAFGLMGVFPICCRAVHLGEPQLSRHAVLQRFQPQYRLGSPALCGKEAHAHSLWALRSLLLLHPRAQV